MHYYYYVFGQNVYLKLKALCFCPPFYLDNTFFYHFTADCRYQGQKQFRKIKRAMRVHILNSKASYGAKTKSTVKNVKNQIK